MLGPRQTVPLLKQAACFMVLLGPFLLALAARQLPDIPEDSPLPLSGADIGANQASGSIHGKLLSPSSSMAQPAAAPPIYTRPRFVRLQRPPITGLVRGQNGALVPFRLKHPLTFFPDPDAAQTFPDPLDRDDASLTKITDEATPPVPSQLGKQYHAVRLLGNGFDGQLLELKKKEGMPFYALSAKGKVWFFDTKDRKEFTYTNKLSDADREYVINFFRPFRVPQPVTSMSGITEQTMTRQPQGKVKWFTKLAKDAKSFFRKPLSFVKGHLKTV